MEYNSVLFRLDDGKPCLFLRKDGKWDFDNVVHLKQDDWPDIASYPFEFVFCSFENNMLTTGTRKTTVRDNTFLTLVHKNWLRPIIEKDFDSVV